jgi:hypothetical protein
MMHKRIIYMKDFAKIEFKVTVRFATMRIVDKARPRQRPGSRAYSVRRMAGESLSTLPGLVNRSW